MQRAIRKPKCEEKVTAKQQKITKSAPHVIKGEKPLKTLLAICFIDFVFATYMIQLGI